jgi:hypothetical protein
LTKNNFDDIIRRSIEIRKKYHQLEIQHHGSEWTVEEDALAYLTDAGLVGRNIMAAQQRWPKADAHAELEHKLGENIWWLQKKEPIKMTNKRLLMGQLLYCW